MPLGDKLQAVHEKVNTKLGVQDASVVFRNKTIVENATFGLADTSTTNTDITITTGLKVGRVREREVTPGAKIQVNDLRLEVPASLLTEAQLKNSEIVYGGLTYLLIQYAAMEIYSSVVVRWRIYARVKE